MAYPFIPESWAEPVNQNLYASILVILVQYVLLMLGRLRKRLAGDTKEKPALKAVFWSALLLPPLAVLAFIVTKTTVYWHYVITFLVSVMPVLATAISNYVAAHSTSTHAESKLQKLRSLGVDDAAIFPNVENYTELLRKATGDFAFLGVGAEKLTRDFNAFQSMVVRCGSVTNPVRLLLVAPNAPWLRDGATRRGLGKSSFLDKQRQSLERLVRVRTEFGGHVSVRFYSSRPVFRLLFLNQTDCWFGHYSESVSTTGENEFADQSNSCLLLKKPDAKAPDREFYGALRLYFDEQWVNAKESEWDFKTYET